jgi:hypothetical protein
MSATVSLCPNQKSGVHLGVLQASTEALHPHSSAFLTHFLPKHGSQTTHKLSYLLTPLEA